MSRAGLVAAIPLPAALIGADHTITCVNPPFVDLFGADPVGRHFITAMRQPAVIEAIEQAFDRQTSGKASYLGVSIGKETTYEVAAAPAGQDVLITLIDGTAALAASKVRRDFIANVSHELRTPLTALMGFIETLRGAARNDEVARDRFLGTMAVEAGRMTRLVDELMTLSRVEETERKQPTDRVVLDDVLRLVRESLTVIAQKADVDLVFDMPEGKKIVLGDAVQLQQVFTNLIENAVKYGGKAGRVTVTLGAVSHYARLRGDGVMITVQDHGIGIAAHHIARLTERFYRVDSHRSREVGGSGLGLAIVKHIINRHSGRLRIESALAVGTTVTVLLPADKNQAS